VDTAIPPREETGSQISARLLEVIAHAEFDVLPELYAFGPLTEGVTPRRDALACVHIVPAPPEVKSYIAVRAQDLIELRNPTRRRG